MEKPKRHRKRVERAPLFKSGYEPGGIGLQLDELLSAHRALVILKMQALRTKEKRYWIAHYSTKVKFDRLLEDLLQKARWKDEAGKA